MPVREAIKILVAEGIVVARPRTWAVVREFTVRDIQDFAEVREVVETLTFVFAAQRHDEAGAARMRAIVAREQEAAAGDVEAARRASAEFHLYAVVLADNQMLTEIARVFAPRLRWLFGQHDDVPGMIDDHMRILDALIARDVDALRDLLPRHLRAGRVAAERRLRSGPRGAVPDADHGPPGAASGTAG
ncbi:GntR family transcriptional regulator [Microbacterium sp. EF45047]|uniref:GntR family transcriptional regulator n=1 Tax=Microbacterium sp. EF45047 TaxID=2809708 RepID=UPI002348FC61|nr:GntR family transcriptional regulator [Microbacterium sp. EF45047]